jgi:hypothetical protein
MTPVETSQLDLHVASVQACHDDSFMLRLQKKLD